MKTNNSVFRRGAVGLTAAACFGTVGVSFTASTTTTTTTITTSSTTANHGDSYKMYYFPITALGEPLRIAMTLAGIPFDDEKMTGNKGLANTPRFWPKMKADPKYQPYGHPTSLPILEITKAGTGEMELLVQSKAILRYIGSIGSYDGAKLYPEDPKTRYLCDEGSFSFLDSVYSFSGRALWVVSALRALTAEDFR